MKPPLGLVLPKEETAEGMLVMISLLKTPTETTEDATSMLLATQDPKP